MTAFAYTPGDDTIHKQDCPAISLEPSEPADRRAAYLRLQVGSKACPACLPGGWESP